MQKYSNPSNRDFLEAVRHAPQAKALDGTILVDLSFIFPGYTDPEWHPLQELLKGMHYV